MSIALFLLLTAAIAAAAPFDDTDQVFVRDRVERDFSRKCKAQTAALAEHEELNALYEKNEEELVAMIKAQSSDVCDYDRENREIHRCTFDAALTSSAKEYQQLCESLPDARLTLITIFTSCHNPIGLTLSSLRSLPRCMGSSCGINMAVAIADNIANVDYGSDNDDPATELDQADIDACKAHITITDSKGNILHGDGLGLPNIDDLKFYRKKKRG